MEIHSKLKCWHLLPRFFSIIYCKSVLWRQHCCRLRYGRCSNFTSCFIVWWFISRMTRKLKLIKKLQQPPKYQQNIEINFFEFKNYKKSFKIYFNQIFTLFIFQPCVKINSWRQQSALIINFLKCQVNFALFWNVSET
jgi:hypothetical protein